MGWAPVLAIALTACNFVFDLEQTDLLEPIDSDGDQIADDIDNCPDVANEDQLDSDGDARGDVCDPCYRCQACAVGPEHDEDGDYFMDGCDNCPTVANDLANADGDDLGDACDPDGRPQRRLLFDGFGEIGPHWQRTGEWRAENDSAQIIESLHPYGYRLTTGQGLINGDAHWTLEVVFEVPSDPAETDSIGANLIGTDGLSAFQCEVLFENGWNITNGIPAPITLPAGLTTMRLSSKRTQDYVCRVSAAEAARMPFGDKYPFGVELYATRVTRYTYVEVIEGLE